MLSEEINGDSSAGCCISSVLELLEDALAFSTSDIDKTHNAISALATLNENTVNNLREQEPLESLRVCGTFDTDLFNQVVSLAYASCIRHNDG